MRACEWPRHAGSAPWAAARSSTSKTTASCASSAIPTTRGRYGYTCAKGRAGPEFHHAPDRLDVPMVRRDGSSTADVVGRRPGRHRRPDRRHRRRARAGRGRPLRRHRRPSRPVRLRDGPRLLPRPRHATSTTARSASTARARPSCRSSSPVCSSCSRPTWSRRRLLLAVGVNTVLSHGHGRMISNPIVHLRELRARGGKVVVIDPRRTETARHADLHVAVRPGTDPALLAFLVGRVLAEGPDAAYLAACAEPAGVERLRRAVAPFDRDHVAAVCGVPGDVLDELAGLVLAAGRVAIETGTGTTMNRAANLTEWLVWALSAVTGSLDRDGGRRLQPRLPATDRGRRCRAAVATSARARRAGPTCPGSSTARSRAPRSPTRSRPATSAPCSCASATRRWPSRATPGCGGRSSASTCWSPSTCTRRETTALATHVLPMVDHFERADLVTGYLQAKPFLRFAPAVVAPSRRAPQPVVDLRRAQPPPRAAAVRQRPPRRAARRPGARRRGDRRDDGQRRPPSVGGGPGGGRTAWPTIRCRRAG